MKYADKLGFPFAIIIGTEEIQSGLLTLKDMVSGTQYKMSKEGILKKLGLN
jgi:histidyl-tRNA synthetase